MTPSLLALNRLRIICRGVAVYDQKFHLGVNIIRGQNGSGKSTIADFIFYILGGEFDDWKTTAKKCEEVQAEIATKGGVITLVREMSGGKQSPIKIFFGSMAEADKQALDGWQKYPIRRSEGNESFSQILFRSIGVPEAPSQGSSNVTMHQVMRVLYADQRTPATRLFRFESFDNRDIREAVGDLICGLNVYEYFENQLKLRELDKQFNEKQQAYTNLLAAMPKEGIANFDSLTTHLVQLDSEKQNILERIENVDELLDNKEVSDFSKERNLAISQITRKRKSIRESEQRIETLGLELSDLKQFISYLEELSETLPQAEATAQIIGNVDFIHCPSCLTKLTRESSKACCIVCRNPTDPHREQSKYLQIKLDLEIQIREAHHLEEGKELDLGRSQSQLKALKREHDALMANFFSCYDISISPRESFLAQQNQRLGKIEKEYEYLSGLIDIAKNLQKISEDKAKIQADIQALKDRQAMLDMQGKKRRSIALTSISEEAKNLLKSDLERQEEFTNPESVTLIFGDDAIIVDGVLNFAESSNVILKNSAILSLFSAATQDIHFNHPRFILLDNVEDKGMEPERSHNFQRLIVKKSQEAKHQHQIIFTTSMINTELETEEYIIGPYYTHANRTLNL